MTTTMHARPFLQSLLARGDEAMYSRMAELVDPGPRQAVILFADVEGSGDLSRRLPSATYFRLIGDFTAYADSEVATHLGVAGKHAGDGVTAFFLTKDLGSPSAAAAAAIETARAIQDAATEVGERFLDDELHLRLRMAVHWGSNLYMGQIVPGGRLDVTALGDEVNECARMQESSPGGTILVSKRLIELLTLEDAKRIDVDPEALLYRPLKELPSVTEKAVRDAGGLSVVPLGG
jgi:class 3 adenylate cyclase